MPGKLYLIPVLLGDGNPSDVLPQAVLDKTAELSHFIVENEKTARRFIKLMAPETVQASLNIHALNKHASELDQAQMLQACLDGQDMGLMSEAGCPGVADPGAGIVKIAHQKGIQVVPLSGPSSILLALMASGMNGQSFAFNGYLPIDKGEKKQALKYYERLSQERNQSQLFIETPYRNGKLMEDLLQNLQPQTLLCVAADLTLPSEFIRTLKVQDWKKVKVDLDKRPAIFIIHKF